VLSTACFLPVMTSYVSTSDCNFLPAVFSGCLFCCYVNTNLEECYIDLWAMCFYCHHNTLHEYLIYVQCVVFAFV